MSSEILNFLILVVSVLLNVILIALTILAFQAWEHTLLGFVFLTAVFMVTFGIYKMLERAG